MSCKLNPDLRSFLLFIVITATISIVLCGSWFVLVAILKCIFTKFQLMEFCSSLMTYEYLFVFNTLDELYQKCAEVLLASTFLIIIVTVILIAIVFIFIDSYKQQKQYLKWKNKKSKWHNVLLSYIIVCD